MDEGGRNLSLDGLRGVAVLLVTLGHANIPLFRYGGGAGVTLFFVLSGYLITTLLLNEHRAAGRISLRAFYARRALRLLPALVVALVGGLIFSVAAGSNVEDVAVAAGATLFYVNNLSHLLESVPMHPFTIYWSLSLEEQFYLMWPWVLLLPLRPRIRSLLAVAIVIASASLVLRFAGPITTVAGYEAAHYLPHNSIWGPLFGAALALWLFERPRPPARPWVAPAAMLALLSVASVAGLWTGIHDEITPTSLVVRLSMPAVAGLLAIVVVADAARERRLSRWLTSRWLVFFGSISYALYLWHGVLDAVISEEFGATGLRGVATGTIAAILAIGAATLSRTFVERPFLRYKTRFERARLAEEAAGGGFATPLEGGRTPSGAVH